MIISFFFVLLQSHAASPTKSKCDFYAPDKVITHLSKGIYSYKMKYSSYVLEIGGTKEKFVGTTDKEAVKRVFTACSEFTIKCLEKNGFKGESGEFVFSFKVMPGQKQTVGSDFKFIKNDFKSANLEKCFVADWETYLLPEALENVTVTLPIKIHAN